MYLTVIEYADIKKYTPQHVRRLCAAGKLQCENDVNEKQRKVYRIPLSTLEPELQIKYLKQNGVKFEQPEADTKKQEPKNLKLFDEFSEYQQKEINLWVKILKDWASCTSGKSKQKTALTNDYIEKVKQEYQDINISKSILYRKQKAYKNGDLEGLVDNRGYAKTGYSSIPEIAWQCFLYHYLDQKEHPVPECLHYTEREMLKNYPELMPLPSVSTFKRHVESDVSKALKTLGRDGEEDFKNRCAPYVIREYGSMRSNEYWIADNHTADVMTLGPDGKAHRPYITAIMDARSGIIVGVNVTNSPNSYSTILALRKAILRQNTICDYLYVDNGTEFLTHDVGGRGHRKRKSQEGKFEPPPILERLGIKMVNAIVKNARAKTIERAFEDFKNWISRQINSFCGGSVAETPEQLKSILKSGRIPTDQEFKAMVEELIYYYMNEKPASGNVPSDKGKTRMQVYAENFTEVRRPASEEDLRLMLMRTERPHKVSKMGVYVTIAGTKLYYYNNELLDMQGKEVYCRYDPEDMSTVRVYDTENKYIMTVPSASDTICKYGSSSEELSPAIKKTRVYMKAKKEELKGIKSNKYNFSTALDLTLQEAEENKNKKYDLDPKVIDIQRANEAPIQDLPKAVGQENTPIITLDTILRNIERNNNSD